MKLIKLIAFVLIGLPLIAWTVMLISVIFANLMFWFVT